MTAVAVAMLLVRVGAEACTSERWSAATQTRRRFSSMTCGRAPLSARPVTSLKPRPGSPSDPLPTRQQVYRVDLGYGAMPWLIVSNNQCNRLLDTVLAARITTSDKSRVPTVVPHAADPLVGYVLADATNLGSLSPSTQHRVNVALALAWGLP